MAYQEMEEFLAGTGEEKAIWILSYKNIVGLVAGAYLGQRLGAAIFGPGLGGIAATLLCAAVGVALTLQVHGILFARRLAIRARFYLRRATAPRIVDGARYAEVVEEREERVRVRRRDDNRSLIGPQRPPTPGAPALGATQPLQTPPAPDTYEAEEEEVI
jgi:hypothetical protein